MNLSFILGKKILLLFLSFIEWQEYGTGSFVASYFLFCYFISGLGFISLLDFILLPDTQTILRPGGWYLFLFFFCCIHACHRKKITCISDTKLSWILFFLFFRSFFNQCHNKTSKCTCRSWSDLQCWVPGYHKWNKCFCYVAERR